MALLRRRGSDDEPEAELPAETVPPQEPPAPEPVLLAPEAFAAPPVAAEPLLAPEPLLSPESVEAQSQFQPVEGADEMLDMPLGTLIFRAGLIAPQQLEDALAEGLRTGKRLGEVLLSRGWLTEDDLARLLAGQKGLPFADPAHVIVDQELADRMRYEDAQREMALPLVIEFGVPVVAMADPNEDGMERIRALIGGDVRFVVAPPSALSAAIDLVLGGPGVAPTLDVASTNGAPLADTSVLPPPPPRSIEPTDQVTEFEQPVVEQPVVEQLAAEQPAAEQPFADAPISEPAPSEFDYPAFGNYETLPQVESLGGAIEQLPTEMQLGDMAVFEAGAYAQGGFDGTEGSTWADQPPVAEPPSVDQSVAEEPAAESSWPPAEPVVDEAAQEGDLAEEQPEAPAITPAWARGETSSIAEEINIVEPVPEPEPELMPEPEPEPEPELEPAAPAFEQAPAPEPPFEPLADGASDFAAAQAPEAPAPEVAADAASPAPVQSFPIQSAPVPVEAGAPSAMYFEVVLRLIDGETVSVAHSESLEDAQDVAQKTIQEIGQVEPGNWPSVGGRFLRPDSILSVDIEQRDEAPGWTGSGGRGRMFS